MKRSVIVLLWFIMVTGLAGFSKPGWAQAPGTIVTVAGGKTFGFSTPEPFTYVGDGGPARWASLNSPRGVAVDRVGNFYIADTQNARIRKVDTSGIITTVAGHRIRGFSGDGGPATQASLNVPSDVAVDRAGNLYIADMYNYRIRKVDTTTGIITTVAGNGMYSYSGDGGPATQAGLGRPGDVAVDRAGNLYITDTLTGRIRKVDTTTGIITTVAGNGMYSYSGDGGPATQAGMVWPDDVAVDEAGNLYIAEFGHHRIRKVDYSADPRGIITTVAGSGPSDPNSGGSFAGDGGPATAARLHHPKGVSVDRAGNLYIADSGNSRIRKVDTNGIITTVAGGGIPLGGGYLPDGTPATQARLYSLEGVAVDEAGNLYIVDEGYNRILKVIGPNQPPVANAGPDQIVECTSPSGTPVTLNGTGSSDPDGDPLTYTWAGPFGTVGGPTPTVTLPMGTHTITLTVQDGKGGTASDEVVVLVQDTTPPEITGVSASPAVLWPPNHKLAPVTVDVTASDLCSPSVTNQIVSVTSNEPDNGVGDGDTANDIQNIEGLTVQLRAERSGKGMGRVYTITVSSTDACGNTATATVAVTVPKSQGQAKVVLPGVTDLAPNVPNPFNPSTRIAYALAEPAQVMLVVYNLLGQEVVRLVDQSQGPGQYVVTWDGRNTYGVAVSSGIYLYRLTTGTGFSQTRRMTFLK